MSHSKATHQTSCKFGVVRECTVSTLLSDALKRDRGGKSEVERYPVPVFVTNSWSCHGLLLLLCSLLILLLFSRSSQDLASPCFQLPCFLDGTIGACQIAPAPRRAAISPLFALVVSVSFTRVHVKWAGYSMKNFSLFVSDKKFFSVCQLELFGFFSTRTRPFLSGLRTGLPT